MTRSGSLHAVVGIASSLPLHDIVLYEFGNNGAALCSVPVALYPPQPGLEQAMYSVREDQWKTTKIIGYKDPRGNDAEVSSTSDTVSFRFSC